MVEILYTKQPRSDSLHRVVISKHVFGTILHLKFYPLQRPVQNKVILASDILPLHAPALRSILFQFVQMLFYV